MAVRRRDGAPKEHTLSDAGRAMVERLAHGRATTTADLDREEAAAAQAAQAAQAEAEDVG